MNEREKFFENRTLDLIERIIGIIGYILVWGVIAVIFATLLIMGE